MHNEAQLAMLKAAREELLSGDYDMLAGLTLAKVAKRAGMSERNAKRAFTAGELREVGMQ